MKRESFIIGIRIIDLRLGFLLGGTEEILVFTINEAIFISERSVQLLKVLLYLVRRFLA